MMQLIVPEKLIQKFTQNLDKFSFFEPNPHLAIAVSGGSDSVALLVLAYYWARHHQGEVTAISVNHNLRQESQQEINLVSDLCSKLKITHYQLDWRNDNLSNGNLQQKARQGRYQLMTELCQNQDIQHLLFAHHQGDLLEHFFLRLSRGSGVVGLSFSEESYFNNTRILRPLYNFTKAELQDLLRQNEIFWSEDSSNNSDKYLRNEIRKKISILFDNKSLASAEFEKHVISSINSMNHSVENLQRNLAECLLDTVVFNNYGYVELKVDEFNKFNFEVKLHVLSYLLTVVSGNVCLPRAESVKRVINSLLKLQQPLTLHGCLFKKSKHKMVLYREFGKNSPTPIMLQNNQVWDSRWEVVLKTGFYNDKFCYVDSISESELNELWPRLKVELPKYIIYTLPIIKKNNKILAIPHIKYYDNVGLKDNPWIMDLKFRYKVNYISKIIHLNVNKN